MSENTEFMRSLEEEYRQSSGLKNRAEYKIFYGQVFHAPILTLGMNPGGSPKETSHDGMIGKDSKRASSSASYFENRENDILDCEWRENTGLRKLLLPLVGDDENRVRDEIVKTNMAFRRSRSVEELDLESALQEAVPFIEKIIARVRPKLIILTGASIDRFLRLYAREWRSLSETMTAPKINHVVFASAAARLRSIDGEVIIVQVAHASQFSWTYEKYGIPAKIDKLIAKAVAPEGSIGSGSHSAAESIPAGRSATEEGHIAPIARRQNPRLAELDSSWRALEIVPLFHQVHHFSSPKFSGKRERMESFIAWCDRRETRGENDQTLTRALNIAQRLKDGQNFREALERAWAAYPIVTR